MSTSWESLTDRAALDEPMSPEELAWLDYPQDDEDRFEHSVYNQLKHQGRPGNIVGADLAGARRMLAERRAARDASRRRKVVGIGAGGTLAAIAAALLLWTVLPKSPTLASSAEPSVTSGTLMADGIALSPGDALPDGQWVVATADTCVKLAEGEGCVTAKSRIRVTKGRLQIEHGSLRYEGTGTVDADGHEIAVDEGEVEITLDDDVAQVESLGGKVFVDDRAEEPLANGEMFALRAAIVPPQDITEPDLIVEDDDEPEARVNRRKRPTTVVSAGDLLAEARRQVASGQTKKALATYAKLQRQHRGSSEARAANVSIGDLELRRGKAKAALAAFSRYLSSGGGALAEEAHWGKIRALHKLGRKGKRDAAIEALRRAKPGSVYLKRAAEL